MFNMTPAARLTLYKRLKGARALLGRVFLGSLIRKTGAASPPPPSAALLILFLVNPRKSQFGKKSAKVLQLLLV